MSGEGAYRRIKSGIFVIIQYPHNYDAKIHLKLHIDIVRLKLYGIKCDGTITKIHQGGTERMARKDNDWKIDFDDVTDNKRKGFSWKKSLLISFAVVIVVVAAAAAAMILAVKKGIGGLYGMSNYVADTGYTIAESIEAETYVDENGNVQDIDEATLEGDKAADVASAHEKALAALKEEMNKETGTYNLLMIGVDRRDSSWNGNSDVMMLATINHDKETIFLTSFLRDLYADIPEVGVRKLNASCAYGGAPLCVETIKRNYGVEIDNYAMVDFNAMIDIVDALGGIELEMTAAEAEVANSYAIGMAEANGDYYENYISVSDGMKYLNGYQAVAYARNRYTGNTYDFGRTERQRKVLMAIFDKAKNGGIGSLTTAAQSVLPYVTHNIDKKDLMELIAQLPSLLGYSIEQQHIPYDNLYHSENEILIPDMEETLKRLRETLY